MGLPVPDKPDGLVTTALVMVLTPFHLKVVTPLANPEVLAARLILSIVPLHIEGEELVIVMLGTGFTDTNAVVAAIVQLLPSLTVTVYVPPVDGGIATVFLEVLLLIVPAAGPVHKKVYEPVPPEGEDVKVTGCVAHVVVSEVGVTVTVGLAFTVTDEVEPVAVQLFPSVMVTL